MRWIILALSLGASITSIIHGVFMLFGSLSIGAGPVGLSSIWLASLPIVSALAALIGGIIAFSGSRWGALFLALATVLCAFAPRDIWIYGGLYCLGALLCIFLRPSREPVSYNYDYETEDGGDAGEDWDPDYEEPAPARTRSARNAGPAPEPRRERQRTSKACPNCGENVPIAYQFCPTCGASLHIPASVSIPPIPPEEPLLGAAAEEDYPPEPERDTPRARTQPLGIASPSLEEPEPEGFEEIKEDGGDDDMRNMGPIEPSPTHKVYVRASREAMELPRRPPINNVDPDTSYQKFSQYARRGKRRSRSVGRRILSMLLLILAVGGALWFLLGLRKLPAGDLPEFDRPPVQPVEEKKPVDVLVQPVEPVAETPAQGLPSFTPPAPTGGLITGSNVNLRGDHSTSSRSVARLAANTRVELLDSWTGQSGNLSGPWYRVRTGDREGWVYGRYLQPLGGELPAGYSNALLRSFGADRSALTERLGQPTRSTDSLMEWSGLSVGFSGGEINRLRVTNSRHELENGLKVGMAQTALFRILGYPSSVSQRQMQYNEGGKTGVSVQLDRNGLIQNILVNAVQ